MRIPLVLCVMCACGRVGFIDGATCDDSHATDVTGDAVDSSGLLFRFTFDGTLTTDSGPAGHDATCTTCPTQVSPGRIGAAAASFDGTMCLDIPDALDLRPIAFTVAAWANVSVVLPSPEQLVTRPDDGATTMNNTFEMYFEPNTRAYYTNIGGATATAGLFSGWHHLAAVYDSSSVVLYFDGTPTGTPASAGAAVYGAGDLWHVGCDIDVGAHDHNFVGLLDDVRLYNRALAAGEVAALAAM